jgi:ABC-2 type transport system permease protein
LNDLKTLLIKEVKELARDPKILIGVILMPLIMFPIMGSAINISQRSVMRAMISASFAVYNEDEGPVVDALLDYLYENNTVLTLEMQSLEDALEEFLETNATTMLYIKEGYSMNVSAGRKARLKVYANLKSLTVAETGSTDSITSLLNFYSYYLSLEKIKGLLNVIGDPSEPEAVLYPLSVSAASIIKGNVIEIAPSAIFSLIMSQSVMLPIMVMVMLMFAIQMAATSIAIEKEQKTLETLMTLPVSRMTILGGKLAGSIVISVAGAIAYMIGFGYYVTSAFSFAPGMTSMTTGDIGLGLQPVGIFLLGINIFFTLVSGLALAISLSVFMDSVRSAQSLTGFLIIPVAIPAIILMFSDISMLPSSIQIILLAIPYTHSILASKAAFLGDYVIVIRSIAYIATFTVIVLYVTARIFSSERIITSKLTSISLKNFLRRQKGDG